MSKDELKQFDIFKMLEILKEKPKTVFHTNNGDLVGFFGKQTLTFGCGSPFLIGEYHLNTMTFEIFIPRCDQRCSNNIEGARVRLCKALGVELQDVNGNIYHDRCQCPDKYRTEEN